MWKKMGRGWVVAGLLVALGAGCVGGGKPPGEPAPPDNQAPADGTPPDGTGGGLVPAPPDMGEGQQPPMNEPRPGLPPVEPPPPSGFPPPPEHFVFPPLQTEVEEYRVQVSSAAFTTMLTTRDQTLFPGEFTGPDGTTYPIQIRLRGNSSRGWPKKSFRVEFPAGVRFDDRTKLNLVSSWREQTLMLEKLGFDVLAALGVPASRAKYVRLTINGQYQGIYLDLERVDKSFLRHHGFVDLDASIWRCGMKNCEMKTFADLTYQDDWEKQTNELTPEPVLDDFMRLINFTPEPQFVEALSGRFELEHHLRTFVMDALISNATVEDSRSYVVYDHLTKRWSYAPWDLNNTDAKYPIDASPEADFEHPLFNNSLFDGRVAVEYAHPNRSGSEPERWKPIFSNLNTRIVNRPELRARILDLTEQALTELFAPAVIHERIDATYALLGPHHEGSPYDSAAQFADAPRYMKEYVANRTAFLQAEIAKWRSWKPGLVLSTVDAQQGYVELKNLGSAPVSTAGMVLTTNLREALPPGSAPSVVTAAASRVDTLTLAPGETVRIDVQLAPEGEVGLFDGKSVVGVIDLLYYGQLPAGMRYVRSEADPLKWDAR